MTALTVMACLALSVVTPCTAALHAQVAGAPAQDLSAQRQGFSVNLGVATTEARGSLSHGPRIGGGAGIAYEAPVGMRFSWRADVSTEELATDIGSTNEGTSDYPSDLRLTRTSLGGSLRRYASNGLFLGLGAAIKITRNCVVHLSGRENVLGGPTERCEDMTTPPFAAVSPSPAVVLAAGVQRGRWELEVRYDQTVGTSARSASRSGTAYILGAFLHYRFGKRAAS